MTAFHTTSNKPKGPKGMCTVRTLFAQNASPPNLGMEVEWVLDKAFACDAKPTAGTRLLRVYMKFLVGIHDARIGETPR